MARRNKYGFSTPRRRKKSNPLTVVVVLILLIISGIVSGFQSLLGINSKPAEPTQTYSETVISNSSLPLVSSTPTQSYSGDEAGGYDDRGRVHVRGYYRKDGTYVRPHTRRAPRR